MKIFVENTPIAFFILYLWFIIKPIKANIEKEVFISNVVKISENLYKEISEWSEEEGLTVGLFTSEYLNNLKENNKKYL
jgi:hypothetical protein